MRNEGGSSDKVRMHMLATQGRHTRSVLISVLPVQFSAYAKHNAQELETLPKEMAMYCQRVINVAIFEAQMGSLNRTSRVVTTTLFYTTATGDRPINNIPFLCCGVLRWTIFFTLSGEIFHLSETVSN